MIFFHIQNTLRSRMAWMGFLLVFSGVPLEAGPRIAGWEITTRTSLSGGYDSNILSNAGDTGDFVYEGSLNFDLTPVRTNSIWSASFGTDLIRFGNETNANSNDFRAQVSAQSTRPRFGSRLQGNASVSYTRDSRDDPQLATRIQEDAFTLNGGLLFSPNSKYSLGLNGNYTQRDPLEAAGIDAATLSDLVNWGLGLQGFYRRSEKLAFTANAGFDSRTGQNTGFQSDNTSLSFSLGADGQLTPKISGTLAAGWQVREVEDTGDTDGTPFFQAGLTWAINSRTSLSLDGSNGFGTLANDQNTRDLELGLSLSRQIRTRWSANLRMSWRESTFSDPLFERADEFLAIGAGTQYQVNDWASLGASFDWSDQQSDFAVASFERIRFELSLDLTY